MMPEMDGWQVCREIRRVSNIPIIINANFGHTTPIFTFPIGGYAKVKANKEIKIEIKD